MRFVLTEETVRNVVKTFLAAVALLAAGVVTYAMYVGPSRNLIEALLWILFQALPPALYWLLFRHIVRAWPYEWVRIVMLIISALLVGFYSIGYLEWIGSIDSKRDLVFFMWPVLALFVVGFIAVVHFVLYLLARTEI